MTTFSLPKLGGAQYKPGRDSRQRVVGEHTDALPREAALVSKTSLASASAFSASAWVGSGDSQHARNHAAWSSLPSRRTVPGRDTFMGSGVEPLARSDYRIAPRPRPPTITIKSRLAACNASSSRHWNLSYKARDGLKFNL